MIDLIRLLSITLLTPLAVVAEAGVEGKGFVARSPTACHIAVERGGPIAHSGRMQRLPILPLAAAIVTVSGCVSAPPPTPIRPAPVAVAPPPAPAPVMVAVPAGDWRDWPLTPGDWTYRQDARGSIAMFGRRGVDAELTIGCDRGSATILLSRRGVATGSAPMTVRTSSTVRAVSAQPTGTVPAAMAASLGSRDPLLDAIGFSRGRFVVEQATLPTLVVPAWPEIMRVVEDCRR